jgi:hypothetical protein
MIGLASLNMPMIELDMQTANRKPKQQQKTPIKQKQSNSLSKPQAKLTPSQRKQVDKSFEVTIKRYGDIIRKLGTT